MVEFNGDLWVVGQFQYVDGISVSGVARYDGVRWNAVGPFGLGPSRGECIAVYQGAVYAGGTGSLVRWNGSSWQSFAPNISGVMSKMYVHQNRLYISGFNAAGGRLYAWDGVSAVSVGTTNGSIESLVSYQNDLIVGGRFTNANGVAVRAVARFDGTNRSTLGTGPGNNTVKALAVFQGQLVAGGDFQRATGGVADFLARWNGSSWSQLGSDSINGTVWALWPMDSRAELHICGDYSRAGARDSLGYSIFQVTPHWTSIAAALPSPRRAPVLSGDGFLAAGARTRFRVSSAEENAVGLLVVGGSRVDVPLGGGTLVPFADAVIPFTTDGIGTWALSFPWPAAGLGVTLWSQAWIVDSAGPQGLTATNGLWLRAP